MTEISDLQAAANYLRERFPKFAVMEYHSPEQRKPFIHIWKTITPLDPTMVFLYTWPT